jgi:hypothetical protein
MVDVEIDIDDDVLFKLMLMAHKRDITLNKFIEQILREYLEKMNKKTSVPEMENEDIFDRIFDDVVNNDAIYTIYEDETYTKSLAVLKKYMEGEYYEV